MVQQSARYEGPTLRVEDLHSDAGVEEALLNRKEDILLHGRADIVRPRSDSTLYLLSLFVRRIPATLRDLFCPFLLAGTMHLIGLWHAGIIFGKQTRF
jgi:hypothetical protein